MFTLKYYSHLLLNSRYKFLITLSIYLFIMLLYNTNNEVYCMEDKKENIISPELSQKLIGIGLFTVSVTLMLIIQNIGGSIDPNSAADAAAQFIGNAPITELPSCIDNFEINDIGDILQNGEKFDLNNVYLNANIVEEQIINVIGNQVRDYKAYQLLQALDQANILNSMYFDLYDAFLSEGNKPENFVAYLNKYLPENPRY